jgi:hypothetical protein
VEIFYSSARNNLSTSEEYVLPPSTLLEILENIGNIKAYINQNCEKLILLSSM